MEAIKAVNICKNYKGKLALDQFSVSIEENKIVGLIGRNGAGKTTFLKTCAGRIRQTSGEIRIFGKPVFDNLEVFANMVFIDEEIQYETGYRIKEIIDLAKTYYQFWDNTLALKLLNFFGLDMNKKYKKLSRGMKTQVNIIVGLCSRMPLTLMDEPTLGLDAAFRKEFYNILLKDYMNYPRTIIISSHLLNEFEMILEDIVLINEGKILLEASVDDIRNYAVKLSGNKEKLDGFIKEKDVINTSFLGKSAEIVIRNSINENDKLWLLDNNVDVSKVSSQDICIYLTGKGESFNEF